MNQYGDISPTVAVKASHRFLKVMQPQLITQRFGQPEEQPMNSGLIRKWRRYHTLPPAVAPLQDGVTPPGHKITYTDYTATLQQFGSWVPLTDTIQDVHTDPVLQIMTDRCSQQAAQTIEIVTFDTLKSGTNVYYANGVASRLLVSSPPLRSDIRKILRGMDRANASPISKIIAPTPNYNTAGVLGGFYAMAHTDLDPDIRAITGFISVAQYGTPNKVLGDFEIGAVDRVRFLLSNNFKPWEQAATSVSSQTYLSAGSVPSTDSNPDVYPIIIVGEDAYGVVRLQGQGKAKMYVLNPGVARGGDPMGQRGSVAWKTWYACVILADQWIARYEVACRATPV